MASRFLRLTTPTLITGLVYWPRVARMVGTGCTHGPSRHVAWGYMTRPCAWRLASASESTSVKNMIAHVAPRWTVEAVMAFMPPWRWQAAEAWPLSTTSYTGRSSRHRFHHRWNQGAWLAMAQISVLMDARSFRGSAAKPLPGMSPFQTLWHSHTCQRHPLSVALPRKMPHSEKLQNTREWGRDTIS